MAEPEFELELSEVPSHSEESLPIPCLSFPHCVRQGLFLALSGMSIDLVLLV